MLGDLVDGECLNPTTAVDVVQPEHRQHQRNIRNATIHATTQQTVLGFLADGLEDTPTLAFPEVHIYIHPHLVQFPFVCQKSMRLMQSRRGLFKMGTLDTTAHTVRSYRMAICAESSNQGDRGWKPSTDATTLITQRYQYLTRLVPTHTPHAAVPFGYSLSRSLTGLRSLQPPYLCQELQILVSFRCLASRKIHRLFVSLPQGPPLPTIYTRQLLRFHSMPPNNPICYTVSRQDLLYAVLISCG
ncbi:hypothetical protein QBC44DRAFT_148094 [Cladorrhinum sp. PSN332]|nr:hypothetical protein QBC44DRAFT_148094 [Cladorrhinum sp. PSN332]